MENKTRKIGALSLSFTIAGCFLGAGYVSGNELWQYFGCYGIKGIYGLIINLALTLIFLSVLIALVRKTGIHEIDRLIIRSNLPVLRKITGALCVFFMFGIFVIMSAGAAALLKNMLKMPEALGALLFCSIVALFSVFGVRGMVKVFSYVVPVLSAVCIGICLYAVLSPGKFDFSASSQNPLLGGYAASAINYVSYNLYGTIGIVAPVALNIKNKRSSVLGVSFGGVILFFTALLIILSLFKNPSASCSELPMLDIALKLSGVLGIIYSVLLFLGMFGTSLSTLVATQNYFESKNTFFKAHRIPCIIALSFTAYAGSLLGFGELISVIYPVCGYLGIISLILICEHLINVKIKEKKTHE